MVMLASGSGHRGRPKTGRAAHWPRCCRWKRRYSLQLARRSLGWRSLRPGRGRLAHTTGGADCKRVSKLACSRGAANPHLQARPDRSAGSIPRRGMPAGDSPRRRLRAVSLARRSLRTGVATSGQGWDTPDPPPDHPTPGPRSRNEAALRRSDPYPWRAFSTALGLREMANSSTRAASDGSRRCCSQS